MLLPANMGDSVDAVQPNSPDTKPLPLLPDNKCQNLSSPESGALLSCMESVMEERPVNVSTEVSGRVRTMDMKIETALKTSIRPFPSVIITRQLTERTTTSDSADSLVRSCLPHTVSDEEEEVNLRLGEALTEGIDKNAKSDAGSSETSTEPLDQVAEISASQIREAASAETVSSKHNGMIQKFHQRASSSDNENDAVQSLGDAGGVQTRNVPQDDLCSPGRDGDISVDTAATDTSSETSGHSDDDVEAALEYYSVIRNGRKNHYIMRHGRSVPRWKNLTSLADLDYRGVRYKVGDVVYILLQNDTEDSFAKIREIRDLADGRKVISVLWYFTIKDARSYGCTTLKRWPKGKSHMLTTMLQVLMWDTINGMVEENVLNQLASGKILDVCTKACKILESDAKVVAWIDEPALVCGSFG
jgi:hypothetical protein